MKPKYYLPALVISALFLITGIYLLRPKGKIDETIKVRTPEELAERYKSYNYFGIQGLTPTPTPTLTPTPKPLTFAEMNANYGPCVFLPTVMYHHIQDMAAAKAKNQQNLTVTTDYFRRHMQYLKDKGYKVLSMADLAAFFDNGASISPKSILITLDDAYDDFSTNALPILREFGFRATVFTPTGLVGNPEYLTWDQVANAATSGVLFANHTWSHKNVKSPTSVVDEEITTADTQLSERGLNSPKVFAYPYGIVSDYAQSLLQKLGYSLAFSTRPGSTLCKKQRLNLPRVRVGNTDLSAYGF